MMTQLLPNTDVAQLFKNSLWQIPISSVEVLLLLLQLFTYHLKLTNTIKHSQETVSQQQQMGANNS